MKLAGFFLLFFVAFSGSLAQTLAPPPVANIAQCGLGILQTIADVIFGIGNAIFTVIKTLITAVLKAISWVVGLLKSLIPTLPDLPSLPPFPTLPPLPNLNELLNGLTSGLQSFLAGANNAVAKLISLLSSFTLPPLPALPPLPNPVQVIGALVEWVKNVVDSIVDIFKKALSLLPPLPSLGDILGTIGNAIRSVVSWLAKIPGVIFTAIKDIFTVLIPYLGNFIKTLIGSIFSGLLPLPTLLPGLPSVSVPTGGLPTASLPTIPTLIPGLPTIKVPSLFVG